MAKHKLLAGLLLGGAAYAAYHALDLEQREALKGAARDRYNAFKDRAVDYAFYAADAADDFKEALDDRLAGKTDAPAWKDGEDTADDEDDDIVLSSDEVNDLPGEEAKEAAVEPTTTAPADGATDVADEKPADDAPTEE